MSLNIEIGISSNEIWLEVSIARQRLWCRRGDKVLIEMQISSAKNGPGELSGSECTPRGWHCIRARIGEGCAVNTVFVGRRPTGEIYSPVLNEQQPGRDWILTRILWLSGLEVGKNRLGNVDTMRRYIYIHGTPDETDMSVPGSHGCLRLSNGDMITLFDMLPVGARVIIQ